MAINTTSSTLTPQAGDDNYSTTETFLTNGNTLILDVMSNDLGGKAKVLWSIDDGYGNPMSPENLLSSDIGDGWETTANGNQIRIIDGHIEYKLGNAAAVNALAANEVMHDTFTYTIRLGNGTLSIATVYVDIVGDNDAATISGTATGGVTEDGTLTTGGTLTVADVDHGEAHFQTPASLTGTYGSFSFNASTGVWGYALNNGTNGVASAVQSLKGGETVFDSLIVKSADGTATQEIKVTIIGTNDVATVSSDSKAVTEGNTAAALNSSGTLTISDPDSGEAHSVAQVATAGTYGTFAIDTNGHWTYTGNGAHNELTAGQVVTDTFTVTSLDGTGSGTVTITITGTNDAPVITAPNNGDPMTLSVAENTPNTTVITNVDAIDIDSNTITYSLSGADASLFTINASTGEVTFRTAPNFEAPADAGGNNVYDFSVVASDGSLSDSQNFAVTVTDVVEGPTVASPSNSANDPNNNNNDDQVLSTAQSGTGGNDTLKGTANADTISGNNGNDTIYGGAGADTLNGNNNDDLIYGGSGNDSIDGGGGLDTIYGGTGDDTITGQNDADTIYGGSGNDTINGGGGNGNDLIIGGYGADSLTGGNGSDTFRFLDILDTGDTITDFTVGAGGDVLDFSPIAAITDNTAHLSSSVATHGISYFQSGADTLVWADTDGNVATVEMQITLTGVTAANLVSANFVL